MKRVINGKTYSKVLGIKQSSLLTAGKDGDIEEYKADPTDAGKVLTVGEDGSVAPAEGGGGGSQVYRHLLSAYTSGGSQTLTYRFEIINDDPTPFTDGTIIPYILSNVLKQAGDTIGVTGCVWDGVQSADTLYIANRLQNVVGSIRIYIGNTKSAETSVTLTKMNGLVDNVILLGEV